ncbi:MAG: tight adherence protein [Solirubrobacteraceae bacterium]|nr:tight adherence protein [Solirubrobacteraceae bacterium]
MSLAALLAGVAGACAVLAAWEAIAAADEERLVQAARGWLAPALEVVRSGREPTSPERRRLVALGALSLLGAGWLLAGPWAGLALGAAAPWAGSRVLRARLRRRVTAVSAGAPAIARALADALAGGHSVRGALIAAAHGGGVGGPAGEELRAAAAALDLGERTEDVLRGLASGHHGYRGSRGSGDGRGPRYRGDGTGPGRARPHGPLDTLVAAILLQRDAGGDLAALLRGLATALEERARVIADARSATAQARFTALLVTGLPAAGLALAEVAQPGFVPALASSTPTALMVALALVLQAVAFACVRRIARIGGPL